MRIPTRHHADHKFDLFEQWRKFNAPSVPPEYVPILKSAWAAGMDSARMGRKAVTDYDAYITSLEWAKFRERYKKSDMPQFCLACGVPQFQLHHLTHKRLGREWLTDVAPLCYDCHKALHENAKARGQHATGSPKKFVRFIKWRSGKPPAEVNALCEPWLRRRNAWKKFRATRRKR